MVANHPEMATTVPESWDLSRLWYNTNDVKEFIHALHFHLFRWLLQSQACLVWSISKTPFDRETLDEQFGFQHVCQQTLTLFQLEV